MFSIYSCSNEELQSIIISATCELARRAQTMGSLPIAYGAPQGWPHLQGIPGWPQQPPMAWPQQPPAVAAPPYPTPAPQAPAWNGNGHAPAQAAQPAPAQPTPPPQQPVSQTEVKLRVVPPMATEEAASAPAGPSATNSIAPLSPRTGEQQATVAAAGQQQEQSAENTSVDYGDPLVNSLVLIYQEATEYPVELLDPKVDLEADLGIDSVKQMQVLGMIKERHGFELPEDIDMKGMRTICEVADSVRHLVLSA